MSQNRMTPKLWDAAGVVLLLGRLFSVCGGGFKEIPPFTVVFLRLVWLRRCYIC